ncbi:serine hydrolase domain-containing protein [Brevibacterium litoralis]|uniref:serine hydrolase domain-containing protein n=1 Tax=Brevibacterium litoralis TaxID=3138935 RepID=UPI0032EBEFC6
MPLTRAQKSAVLHELASYLTSWVDFQQEYTGVPGIQVALGFDGETVLDHAAGRADVTTDEPLTTDHLFRIASHSKTFTAVTLFRLVEDGDLRLDDTVGHWVPELAECPAGDLTVRELLGHQGGVVRDSSDGDFWQRGSDFLDRRRLVDVVRREGAVYPANTHFKYSNVSYSLLGLVIEEATGLGYAEATRRAIVEPLGLRDTGAEYDPARGTEYAAGHTGRLTHDDTRRVIPHVDTQAMAAATGWYSTAAEMTVYGSALVMGDTRLLSDSSKRLMQREESRLTAPGGEVRRYGLGLDLETVGERELVGHSGGYPGHITRTWIDPQDGLVVSALTNAIDGPAGTVATGIVQIVDAVFAAVDSVLTGRAVAVPEDLQFSGRFANLWGSLDVVSVGASVHAPALLTLGPRAPLPVPTLGRLVVGTAAGEPVEAGAEVHVPAEGKGASDAGTDAAEAPAGWILLTEPEPGFHAHGEPVELVRDGDGSIRSARIGAMTSWPIETYRAALATERPDRLLDGRLSLH